LELEEAIFEDSSPVIGKSSSCGSMRVCVCAF